MNFLAVNPGHWTVDMRDDALEPAKLDDPGLKARLSALRYFQRVRASTSCTIVTDRVRWSTSEAALAFARKE